MKAKDLLKRLRNENPSHTVMLTDGWDIPKFPDVVWLCLDDHYIIADVVRTERSPHVDVKEADSDRR